MPAIARTARAARAAALLAVVACACVAPQAGAAPPDPPHPSYCDDEEAPPPWKLKRSKKNPISFEDVDENRGPISAIYPPNLPTHLSTWYSRPHCDWSIGGEVTPADRDSGVADELAQMGVPLPPHKVAANLGAVGRDLVAAEKTSSPPANMPPIGCERCRQAATQGPPRPDLPFSGRDVIFVHGLDTGPLFDAFQQVPAALTTWPAHPAQFYSGYWKQNAEAYWRPHIRQYLKGGGNQLSGNRYLVVSWASTQRLVFGVHAVLSQIATAMDSGFGVVNELDPQDTGGFCASRCVIVTHSAGGPLVSAAMGIANRTKSSAFMRSRWGNIGFIPDHVRAAVAFHGAFGGSHYASAAAALGMTAYAPLCDLAITVVQQYIPSVTSCTSLTLITSSVLVDLVPEVMRSRWGPRMRQTPVPMLLVAGGHPTSDGRDTSPKHPFLKHLLHLGTDDGVLTANSQCANPRAPAYWPSGYLAISSPFNRRVLHMHLRGSAKRARAFYLDQVIDPHLSDAPIAQIPEYAASGCTPYVSPAGMVQPVAVHEPASTPFRRIRNHYSFLESTSDHYFGPTGPFGSPCYEQTPKAFVDATCSTPRDIRTDNAEEILSVSDPFVYASGLVNPAFGQLPEERVIGKRLKIGKKKTKAYRWKRTLHLLRDWEVLTEGDYVYRYVLR